MRFLLCLIIWVVFIGGLYLYTSGRDGSYQKVVAAVPDAKHLEQLISVELTPTFSVEEDPFALKTEEKKEPFEIRLNGEPISLKTADISRGELLLISDVKGVRAEHNGIFIKASPPVSENNLDHGIRVRLLNRDQVLAGETIWSSGGGLVSGSVSFMLDDTADSNHDH